MPFGQIAGQPIPFIARLSPFLPSGCFPIIYRLSQPVNQWKVCAVTSRQGKVREARSKPAAARIVPFHAGASTCRNNTVFHSPTGLYAAGFGLSASVPYLSLVTCHVKGKQRYFLSAPRFHSARSKFRRGTDKENPFHVCPGRPLPDPPKPHSFLLHFLLHLYPARPYPPFYHHIYRPVPVSSPPSPSGFPAAKVGCRA